MTQKIVFPTGGIYIGIKRKGDANTNEILHRALIRRGFSTEFEVKEYGGEKVEVWIVDSDFVNMLYPQEKDFILKFVVYMEIEYVFQEFCLIDPVTKKAAKHARILKRQMAKK